MAVSLQITTKQTQKLAMTQSLKQAIELLQLSVLELSERISNELLENPVLEELSAPGNDDSQNNSLDSGIHDNLNGNESHFDKREEELLTFGNSSDSGFVYSHDEDRNKDYMESVVAQRETLSEHLLWQARLSARDEKELDVYESVITSLNADGFLTQNKDDFVTDEYDAQAVKDIIDSISFFDPVGCAVANVQESLFVQALYYCPGDEILQQILTDHFSNLEKLNYEKISSNLSISKQTVIDKSKIIQSFDPFPGRQYSTRDIRYIIPEVEVMLIDDEIIINMNDDWLQNVGINSYYIEILKKKSIEKNLKEYIQDKMQAARYLIRNIASRRETIKKVVRAIMNYQKNFLLKGPGNLRPLTHIDIANEIGMHESTVSRVTSNKFVQTSWGVFELKYFFVSRLKSTTSEDHSSDQVMSLIKAIIEHENPEKPYSDEEIISLLKKNGIDMARRTVSKYRGILHIPPSNKRKKLNLIKSEEKL